MQIPEARKWYRWLWWSPLLTIPTLLLVYFINPGYALVCGSSDENCTWWVVPQVTNIIAVVVSAMWHLILLKPALDKERPFVRWHGRQALLLAGVRTAIPLSIAVIFTDEYALLNSIPFLIVVWFFGTIWGQRQAARGDCSILRWFTRQDKEGKGGGMQIPEARKWYRWLWWSPLITVPTSIVVGIWNYFYGEWDGIPVVVFALWHLILLRPAMDRERPFVRWHGRQALLLAGLQTVFVAVFWFTYSEEPFALLLLVIVWFFGTLWGQRQAARGDCSTLRWFARDQAEVILTAVEREKEAVDIDKQTKDLVYAIRFGRSPEQRQKALAELEALDMVETL